MRNILLAMSPLLLAACTDTVISNGTIGGAWGRHDIPVTYTTADVRMITERVDPRDQTRKLVCSEPAPDVAKALATAAQATVTARGGGGGAVNVGVSGGYSSAEALLELAGRSTALLGLRDGLFRACEAYANGAIGDDAYALLLSRYGQLMVTVFLSQDIASAARGAVNSVLAPVVSAGGGAASGGTAGGGTGNGGPAGSSGGVKPSASHVTGAGFQGLLRGAAYVPGIDARGSVQLVQANPLLDGSNAQVGLNPPPTKGATTPSPKNGSTPNTQDSNAPQPASGVNAQAAQEIERLGEAYFNQDKTYVHSLMVACISEYDETRPNWLHKNIFLEETMCPMFGDMKKLKMFVDLLSSPTSVLASGAGVRGKLVAQRRAH